MLAGQSKGGAPYDGGQQFMTSGSYNPPPRDTPQSMKTDDYTSGGAPIDRGQPFVPSTRPNVGPSQEGRRQAAIDAARMAAARAEAERQAMAAARAEALRQIIAAARTEAARQAIAAAAARAEAELAAAQAEEERRRQAASPPTPADPVEAARLAAERAAAQQAARQLAALAAAQAEADRQRQTPPGVVTPGIGIVNEALHAMGLSCDEFIAIAESRTEALARVRVWYRTTERAQQYPLAVLGAVDERAVSQLFQQILDHCLAERYSLQRTYAEIQAAQQAAEASARQAAQAQVKSSGQIAPAELTASQQQRRADLTSYLAFTGVVFGVGLGIWTGMRAQR